MMVKTKGYRYIKIPKVTVRVLYNGEDRDI